MKSRKNKIDEQLLEILLSFTDFNLFKDMMIDYKLFKFGDNAFSGFSLNIEKTDMNNHFILEVCILSFFNEIKLIYYKIFFFYFLLFFTIYLEWNKWLSKT